MNRMLDDAVKMKQLAERLRQYEFVYKFDSDDESEAWRLAHSLSDLEDSFIKILKNYLPALCSAESEEETHNALLNIGEELRHVLYHTKDPRFYCYLFDDK